jgi:hypothetical protein
MTGWIAVDFDGTLAHYDGWVSEDHLGDPIPVMVERVKRWLASGHTVKVFTARVGCTGLVTDKGNHDSENFASQQRRLIQEWCVRHIGIPLEVTATKDFGMIELWDDRAVQVKPNSGEPIGNSTRELV